MLLSGWVGGWMDGGQVGWWGWMGGCGYARLHVRVHVQVCLCVVHEWRMVSLGGCDNLLMHSVRIRLSVFSDVLS